MALATITLTLGFTPLQIMANVHKCPTIALMARKSHPILVSIQVEYMFVPPRSKISSKRKPKGDKQPEGVLKILRNLKKQKQILGFELIGFQR